MKQLIISRLIDIYFVQDNELRHLVQKNTQCGYTDWVNVSIEIGHGMTNTQCIGRWANINKSHNRKPRCQTTSTAVSAYLPVDPELLVLMTGGGLEEDSEVDRYDADVEIAFNKQGRKREPDDRRTMWTTDMVIDYTCT